MVSAVLMVIRVVHVATGVDDNDDDERQELTTVESRTTTTTEQPSLRLEQTVTTIRLCISSLCNSLLRNWHSKSGVAVVRAILGFSQADSSDVVVEQCPWVQSFFFTVVSDCFSTCRIGRHDSGRQDTLAVMIDAAHQYTKLQPCVLFARFEVFAGRGAILGIATAQQ